MSILSKMDINNYYGDLVKIGRTDNRHFDSAGKMSPLNSEGNSFSDLLFKSLNDVNNDQQSSQALFQQMITDPDSVEVHEVTIAMAKAEMSLKLTAGIIDRAVKAYKEITSLR